MNEEREKGTYYSGSYTPNVNEIAAFYSQNRELDEMLTTRTVGDLDKTTYGGG